jgi:hypothetical protein
LTVLGLIEFVPPAIFWPTFMDAWCGCDATWPHRARLNTSAVVVRCSLTMSERRRYRAKPLAGFEHAQTVVASTFGSSVPGFSKTDRWPSAITELEDLFRCNHFFYTICKLKEWVILVRIESCSIDLWE